MPVNEKVLIIHHFEPIWEAGFLSHGTSFEHLCERTHEHIKQEYYDKVILTHFACDAMDTDAYQYTGLLGEIDVSYTYEYGWGRDDVSFLPDDQYCKGGCHSEYVLLPDWMKELRGKISLCGCFLGECLEDMQIALAACGHEHKMVRDLVL